MLIVVRQVSIGEIKFERMHKAEWIHFKTEIKRFPFADAKKEWDENLAACAESEKQYTGPDRSVTIPMPCSDSVRAQSVVEQAKEFTMVTKKRKITSEEDADQMIGACRQGHVGFGNEIFSGVGGETFARAAALGGTSIGAHGSGSFHDVCGASPTKSAFGEAVATAAAQAKAIVRVSKDYDIVTARLKVSQDLEQRLKQVGDKVTKVKTDAETTKGELACRIAESGAKSVPFASSYADIVTHRLGFAALLNPGPGVAGKLDTNVHETEQLGLAKQLRTALAALEKGIADGTQHAMITLQQLRPLECMSGRLLNFGLNFRCRCCHHCWHYTKRGCYQDFLGCSAHRQCSRGQAPRATGSGFASDDYFEVR